MGNTEISHDITAVSTFKYGKQTRVGKGKATLS